MRLRNILETNLRSTLTTAFPLSTTEVTVPRKIINDMSEKILLIIENNYPETFEKQKSVIYLMIQEICKSEANEKVFDVLYAIYNEDTTFIDIQMYIDTNGLALSFDNIYDAVSYLTSDNFFSFKYNMIYSKLLSSPIFSEIKSISTNMINTTKPVITTAEDEITYIDNVLTQLQTSSESIVLDSNLIEYQNPIEYFRENNISNIYLKKYDSDSSTPSLKSSIKLFLLTANINNYLEYKFPNQYFRNFRCMEERYDELIGDCRLSGSTTELKYPGFLIESKTVNNMLEELSREQENFSSERTKKSASLLFDSSRPGVFYNNQMNKIHLAVKNKSYEYFTEKDIEQALGLLVFPIIEIIDERNRQINKNIDNIKSVIRSKRSELGTMQRNAMLYTELEPIINMAHSETGQLRIQIIQNTLKELEYKLRRLEFEKFSYLFPSDNMFMIDACHRIYNLLMSGKILNIEEMNFCKFLLLLTYISHNSNATNYNDFGFDAEKITELLVIFYRDLEMYDNIISEKENYILSTDKRFRRGV